MPHTASAMIAPDSRIGPRPRTVTDSHSATIAATTAMSTEAPTTCGSYPTLPAIRIAVMPV
jgi:hypothetical protein